jgi:hypothetical protein
MADLISFTFHNTFFNMLHALSLRLQLLCSKEQVAHKQLKNCSLSIGIIVIDINKGCCRNKCILSHHTAVSEDEVELGGCTII